MTKSAKVQASLLLCAAVAAVISVCRPLPGSVCYTVLAGISIVASVVVLLDIRKIVLGGGVGPSFGAALLLAVTAVLHRNLDMVVIAMIGGAAVLIWVAAAQILADDDVESRKARHGSCVEEASQERHPPQRPAFPTRRPTKTFSDVMGMGKLKRELDAIAREICDVRVGNGKARNGILLYGEPGTGKTLIAEALAGQMGLPFLPVTIGEIASRWVNQTTEQLQQVFTSAAAQAPCVLFLDEIDSCLVDRSSIANGDSEAPRIANSLLTNLVDIRGKGVVVVAATNHLNKLDAAGIREGRFDFKIEVPPPDKEARLHLMLTRVAHVLRHAEFDYIAAENLAARWEGFSAARIGRICDEVLKRQCDGPDVRYSYDEWSAALRSVQGTLGDPLPESAVPLSELIQTDKVCSYLSGLARRMKDSARIEAMGGSIPTGLLLCGPPGSGKSRAVQSLAKSTGWAMIQATGGTLRSPEAIDRLVRRAKDIRPTIVFVDEADDLLVSRVYATDRTLPNHLLAAIDGAGGQIKDILWVAATNYAEQLDPAALRGGRFTEKLEFSRFDLETMERFVGAWRASSSARFAPDLTARVIAKFLGVESVANATAILNTAVNMMIDRSVSDSVAVVSKMDLAEARARILTPAAAIR